MSFSFYPLNEEQLKTRKEAWDGLLAKRPFGRAAVMSCPKPDIDELSHDFYSADEIPLTGPAGDHPVWDDLIRKQVRQIHLEAMSRYEDDSYPAISIPRSIHGQSQAIAEVFGCRLLEQPGEPGLYYSVPWIEKASDLKKLKPLPVASCLMGQAIAFAMYARAVTNQTLAVRNPVMVGPLDSANYILGTTRLMQWIYDEPQALHELLSQLTEFIIGYIQDLQKASGNTLCPDHCWCLPRGFNLCSEVRHLISADQYQTFEAPYLRQIGQVLGPYMIHSCGTWERMLPFDLADENLIMIHFQIKEMNLEKVYALTQGKLSLYVGESINVDSNYLWPDKKQFYKHLMTAFPKAVPLSFSITDISSYLEAQDECNGGTDNMFHWSIRHAHTAI